MDDRILSELLVKKDILTQQKTDRLIHEAQLAGKNLETYLYDGHSVDDVILAQLKSEYLKIPFKRVPPEQVKDEFLKLVPPEVATNYRFVPIDRTPDTLIVGMLNPDDRKAQDALRFIAQKNNMNVGVYILAFSDFEILLRKYSPFRTEVEEALRTIEEQAKGSKAYTAPYRTVELEKKTVAEEAGPIIRLVASIFKNAVEENASDIHVEPQRNRLRVRFRLDGELQEVLSLPIPLHQPIISRIKILADLKIDENRRPQDGRFRTSVFNKDIDFRVSTFPTTVGEKAVLRVLDPAAGLKSITDLGMTGKNFDILKRGIDEPYGMILITGPTGSGKTTTLYSILQVLNQEDVNVISLEDPVEYTIEGPNQSQIMPEIGYTFASGLRQILRQDPDIIMVGEVRDNETAELAIHASLTGHLVLSTLHTNNAVGVIPRLVDMNIQPFLISPALNMMISQRLVAKLCPDCKKSLGAPSDIQAVIKKELSELPSDLAKTISYRAPYTIYSADGCAKCKQDRKSVV